MKGEFYKMDFRAWNIGTVDLTLEQEAAYLRLCHAMYDIGGPVPNSTRMLMGLFRCGNTKATALLSALIAAGKIAVTSDDRLINHRVTEELASREKVSSARRIAGERGGSAPRATGDRQATDLRPTAERLPSDAGANQSKPLGNNDLGETIASALRSRGEERRGDRTDPNGSGSVPLPLSPKDMLWTDGVLDLVGMGAEDRNARRMVGKWMKDTGNDAGRISWAISEAKLAGTGDPIPLIARLLSRNPTNGQARASPNSPGSSPQQRALDRARQAHLDLMEDRHDQDPSDADAERNLGASGPQNGHSHSDVYQPPGGRLGLAPPRLGGPPRPN